MSDFNVRIPLPASLNERNVLGYAASTAGYDQRKINSFYEVAKNPATGKTTPYLVKRPGITLRNPTFGSTSAFKTFSAVNKEPNGSSNYPWIFATNSQTNDATVSDSNNTTTVIANIASTVVRGTSLTLIGDTEYVVVQLSSGTTQRAFYSSAIATWTEISDSDFTSLSLRGQMVHLDGYAFILDANNKVFNSDLNSLSSWGATSYIRKSIQQDISVGLLKFKDQILAGGAQTCETFGNAGNPTGSPLTRVTSLQHRIGLVSPSSAELGGKLYVHGALGGGDVVFSSSGIFAYNGQSFEKVSTPFVDKFLVGGAQSLYAISFFGNNAIAVYGYGTDATKPIWLLFFPDLNEWFEWESSVFTPINYHGVFVGKSDPANNLGNKVYCFDASNIWQDNAVDYTMLHRFRFPGENGNRQFMGEFGVIGDTTSAQNLGVAFSDDDDVTYSADRNISMAAQKKTLTRGGSFYKRTVRLTHTGNNPCRLTEFIARVK